MGLHFNDQSLPYSLSTDGMRFQAEQSLFNNLSTQDLNIVALSYVTRGNQLLGVLYGATTVASLDQNKIFGRWLQKRIVLTDSSGLQHSSQGGYGPDRQWFQAPASGSVPGTILVYAEDGITPLAAGSVNLSGGQSYLLVLN